MSKTPIMILQEVAMKCNMGMPVYTEISSNYGGHQNQFTIGVKWETYNAKGMGTSKKQAKQNAAKEMLSLLSLGKVSEQIVSLVSQGVSTVTHATPEKLVSSVTMNTLDRIPNDYSEKSFVPLSCPSISASNSNTNYVGLLQEYCVSKNIPSPHFDVVNVSGPSHMLIFTMSCDTICGHEKASATTKKCAKQQVAKKMLQRLTENTDRDAKPDTVEMYANNLNVELMNLSLDEPQSNNFTTEKALTTYNKLKDRFVPDESKLQIKDYHHVLANLCCNIPQVQKAHLLYVYTRKVCNLEGTSYLKDSICSALQTVAKKITFRVNNKSQFMIGLRLSFCPVILQIGIGESMEQAERQALRKVFEFILLFIK